MKADVELLRIDRHSTRLQSMRGLAALSVLIGHSFITLPQGRIEDPNFKLSAGNALLAAGELLIQPNTAVVFFYVLSGLVLRESLRRRSTVPLWPRMRSFAVRRLFRLIPAMWASLALAIAILPFLPTAPIEGATAFYNSQLGKVIAADTVVKDAVAYTYTLNPVLWSIQVELVMIPIIPLLLWIANRLSPISNAIMLAALCLAYPVDAYTH